jgi:hypothetical protein
VWFEESCKETATNTPGGVGSPTFRWWSIIRRHGWILQVLDLVTD